MRNIAARLSVLVLANSLAGCKPETRSAISPNRHWSPAQLVGCYEILDANRRRADSAWYNVMGLVQLTDVPVLTFDGAVIPHVWHLRPLSDARNGHWRADPLGTLERERQFVPDWSLNSSGESATFGFGDGFSGATIQFNARDADRDTLRGRVTEHWDYGPPFSYDKGVAYAVRRACPVG